MAAHTGEWKAANLRASTIYKALLIAALLTSTAAFFMRDHALAQGAVQREEFVDSVGDIRSTLTQDHTRIDTALVQIKGLIEAGQRQQLRVLCAQARTPVDICRATR